MNQFTLTVATIAEAGQRAMALEAISSRPGFARRIPAPLGPTSSDAFGCGSMIVIGLGQIADHLAPGDRLVIASPIGFDDLGEGQDWGMSAIIAEAARRHLGEIRESGVEVETRVVDENDLGFRRTQRLAREGLGDPRAALLKMEEATPSA